MAKMESQAGEMELRVEESSCEKGNLIFAGKLGVWDSTDTGSMPVWVGIQHVDMDFKVYFSAQDIWHTIPLLFRPSVILFLFSIPFRSLGILIKKLKSHIE